MMALIPAFTALSEIVVLGTRRLTIRLGTALLIGILGVAVLMNHSFGLGGLPIDRLGALALIFAALSWSLASALARKLPLPSSKTMSSGTQMLSGGLFLGIAAALLGELPRFHPASVSARAWLALLYLIVPGSIIAFTAYVWLLHRESPTKVGTYAYVNPVVAVLLGYFVGGESLDLRTALGTACVLISVVVITSHRI
jgi:drug/metabolite transporter (DMT)-like permease